MWIHSFAINARFWYLRGDNHLLRATKLKANSSFGLRFGHLIATSSSAVDGSGIIILLFL
jgi:hypothetical protein